MVLRENKNNAHAKFGGTNKEYYGIFRSGLLNLCFVKNEIHSTLVHVWNLQISSKFS